MRPKSIVYFEGIMLGTLALGLVQTTLGWSRLTSMAAQIHVPLEFVISTQILTFLLLIALVLLISRRKSRIAMWISITMFALGIFPFIAQVRQGLLLGSGFITAVQLIGETIAYCLLFTPSTRQWMSAKNVAGRSGIADVFE